MSNELMQLIYNMKEAKEEWMKFHNKKDLKRFMVIEKTLYAILDEQMKLKEFQPERLPLNADLFSS